VCAALVPLVVGVQAAQACTEPVFEKTFPYATAGRLVPMQLTGVTPGTEYLLKVGGREVKEGVAQSDKVTRRFRMPKFGDKRRDVRLVVVLANDGCENSPWKLTQEMGYRPPPVQPKAQEEPASPPASQPQSTAPAPAPAPAPTPAPAISSPAPKPVKPVQSKPFVPKQPTGVVSEPAADARTWLTPLDVYSRGSEAPPQPPRSVNPLDRRTEDANSTAALVGLGGLFILVSGIAAMAWTRFRRYDDEQLATLLNPDGKLPSLLDEKAADLGAAGMTGAAGAIAAAGATSDKEGGERADAIAEKQSQMAPQPAVPKTDIKAPILPPAVVSGEAPTEKQPALAPAENGAHTNGTHTNGSNGAHAGNGSNGSAAHSYRQEVESELQRILQEAGLDTELEGILTDARAEAERQGVPMDSDLMLRALTGDADGSARLSDSAKGELKERFQRIAAEERGETHPAGEQ
jgi:hypothetical protein